MQKQVSLIAGAILLSVPGIAVAKDKEDARIEAMLACEGIVAN